MIINFKKQFPALCNFDNFEKKNLKTYLQKINLFSNRSVSGSKSKTIKIERDLGSRRNISYNYKRDLSSNFSALSIQSYRR